MKKYFPLLFLFVFAAPAICQEIKISKKLLPKVITDGLKMEYPNARISGATREITKGDTLYEVFMRDSHTQRTVTMHPNGIPEEIEESMTIDQLPSTVTDAITKQYPKGKIMRLEMIMRGPVMTYEVQIKDRKKKVEVEYGMDGSIIPAK